MYYVYNYDYPRNTGQDNWWMQPELAEYFPPGWPAIERMGQKWKWVYWPATSNNCFTVDLAPSIAEIDSAVLGALQMADEMCDDGKLGSGKLSVRSGGRLRYYLNEEFPRD
jgi:hypothetical protein